MDTIRTDVECQEIARHTGIKFAVWRGWFRVPDVPLRFRVAMQGVALKSLTRRVRCSDDGCWFIYPSYRAGQKKNVAETYSEQEKKREYRVKAWGGASLIRSERVPSVGDDRKQKGGGVRGVVKTYTPASRSRLQVRLAQFENSHLSKALFVTLTYPAKYPKVSDAKKHLRAFMKRVKQRFPMMAACWRMEFQKRKAVHFHVLIIGVRYLPSEVVARWWYDIVGSDDLRHLEAGTEVKRVKSAQHAAYYVSKYISKSEGNEDRIPPGQKPGRFWGFEGRTDLYIGEIIEIVIEGGGHIRLSRFMRSLIKSKYKKNGKKFKDRPPAIGCSRSWFADVDAVIRGVASVGLLG